MARDYHRTLYRMGKLMQRKGCKKLGNGIFGAVYEHPTDKTKVIKWGPLADGWVAYAAWVDAHRSWNNPHLPVIHSMTRFEKQGVYCAVMERLHSTVYRYRQDKPRSRYAEWDRIGKYFFKCGTIDHRDHWSDAVHVDVWNSFISKLGCRDTLEPLLIRLRNFADRHGLSKDLHDENVMLRKVGRRFELVITDPFSFGDPDKAVDELAALRAAA